MKHVLQTNKMEKQSGEIVCKEQPYVHVLSSQMRGELCDYCFDR